ncbi:dTMP kinase [Rhabdaerophilum sp. SD176]|uniref:dTMP kinase n=1 Tax=Rhabdaerophilum sp. SD176 TaxID=2983548 RepID=UPI0024E01EB7|nr:dTMP kinase [Rhabdaerophilum sp. SD176]
MIDPGFFITFEGGEGAGKSTQIRFLAETLRAAGHEVVLTREPGGTPLAEAIRGLLLNAGDPPEAMTQALLFAAARFDHVSRVIRPAMRAGQIVLCDRFADSTRAYQGEAVAEDALEATILLGTSGLVPDLTLLLDLPPEAGLARARQRGTAGDAFERADLAFHARVRARFLALARREPDRIHVVDADRPAEAVAASIRALVVAHTAIDLAGAGA